MAFTKYSDILDPEVIKKLIGEQWLNLPKVVKSGIVRRDARAMQGSLTSELRQKVLQGRSGQALKAGDSISFANKSQEKANMPNLWRYDGINMPDVIEAIEVKDVPVENAGMALEISNASAQFVDNSVIKMLEGVAAALAATNAFDYSATGDISLDALLSTMVLAKDKSDALRSGAIVMHSKVEFDAIKNGVLAATANTYGNTLQDQIVRSGQLPANILGMTPIVTDKLDLDGTDYRTYLVGLGALILRGNEAPTVEVGRPDDAFTTLTKFMVHYGVGVSGMKWGATGAEDVSDTDLGTSSNWTLGTNTNSNDVVIYRLQTT